MSTDKPIYKSLSAIILQSRITILILIAFIVGLLFLLKVSYDHSKSNLLDHYENIFSQRATILDNSIGEVVEHLKRMKSVSDECFKIPDDSIMASSVYESFKKQVTYNDNKKFFLWRTEQNYSGLNVFSNIAGKKLIKDPQYLKTIIMSLRIQEVQRSFHENCPNTALSYYISNEQYFTQIYPPIPLSEMVEEVDSFPDFIDKAYEVYHEFLDPLKNPEYKHFWTRPYIDRAGNGMMVTCAVPIVSKGKILGVLGADILLGFLNKHTKHNAELPGHFQLVSEYGDIISKTDLIYNKEDELQNDTSLIIDKKEHDEVQWRKDAKGNYYLAEHLNSAPWSYIAELDNRTIFQSTLSSIKVDILIIFVILITIPFLFYYIKKKIVLPGLKAEIDLQELNSKLESTVHERTKQLIQREENLKITLNSIADAVISTDINGTILGINPVASYLLGIAKEEAVGKSSDEIFNIFDPDTLKKLPSPIQNVLKTEEPYSINKGTLLKTIDGNEYLISDTCAPIISGEKEMVGTILVFRDVSDEIRMEKQLIHNRKMDAIGQLAGGISHDFNNMIGGILGAAELIKRSGEIDSDENSELINIIIETSKRSSELVAKLLAFSRKESFTLTGIDIHKVLDDTISILKRTIDKQINIVVDMQAENLSVFGDNAALQNSFMNIGINASQVMKEGGELEFSTKNLEIDELYCHASSFNLIPGTYIQIAIRDNGTGISKNVITKIFDPFFTTKDEGEGTGLGLAAVYGTVKSHKGEILVESDLGIGTTFFILLPCSDTKIKLEKKDERIITGKGNILLIDDEKIIRVTVKNVLKKLGYTAIIAKTPSEGLSIFKEKHSEIDLVISDMIMPEMNGSTLFYKFKEIDSKCPFIILSGFTRDQSVLSLQEDGLSGFIKKPFSISEMSRVIQKVLSS